MTNHIPLTSWACEKRKPACCHMKVSFRAILETWATPPNISCFLNRKVRFWSVSVFLIKKNWGVKNKGTIRFTNHFDLGCRKKIRSLGLTEIPWSFPGKLLWFQRNRGAPRGLLALIFAGYVPLASQSPYPIIVYSVANCRPHVSHFWADM